MEDRAYAKVDRRIVPFLFLCYILAYLDRVNVGFAKLQMSKDLALSDAAFATGAGIFFIGYFLFEVPSNVALKKFGARLWIARIMITWGIISAAMMFVSGEWSFYAMRFILGLAEAGFFPGDDLLPDALVSSGRRATRTAWFVSAARRRRRHRQSGFRHDHGPVLRRARAAGWQWLFLMEGIPSIIVGVWVIFYLDSSIQEANWLTAEEKALLAGTRGESAQKTDTGSSTPSRPAVYLLSRSTSRW